MLKLLMEVTMSERKNRSEKQEVKDTSKEKKLEVVAGILLCDNKILCAQRPKGKYDYISYKFEFPGGKVEAGETAKEALCRELMEELAVSVREEKLKLYDTVKHRYPDFEVTIYCFLCPVKCIDIQLMEHESAVWVNRHELGQLDWVEADLPVISKLMEDASIFEGL